MHYAQPPAGGGYPPQSTPTPAQQAPSQPYYPPQAYQSGPAAGPAAPPAAVIRLAGLGLMLLGVVLRCIPGFMDPGDGASNVYTIGALILASGVLVTVHGFFDAAFNNEKVSNSLKITALILSVILILTAIGISARSVVPF